jgi:hypothetical protein
MLEIKYSDARADLATLFDHALTHRPVRIVRRRDEPAVLLSDHDLRLHLDRYHFSPDVYFGEGSVEIWLPELAIWGRGPSFADARDDLLDEIDQLLFLLEQDALARQAPNIVSRLPWIYRLSAARDDGERIAMLFAEPAAAADGDVP